MGKGNKYNFTRKRKRKGPRNQYRNQNCRNGKVGEKYCTRSNRGSNVDDCIPCTSAKKMKLQKNLQDNIKDNGNNYFLHVKFSVFQGIFAKVSRCPDCSERLTLSDNLNNRMGMAHNFQLNWDVSSY